MQQSCRVGLAAYLHDLGKFAERAGTFDGSPRLDAHLQLYAVWNRDRGYFSHRHAAHTALAFDLIEKHLPDLLLGDASPFTRRVWAEDLQPDVEPKDSLINASAAHHKPETFLQWVVATADRVASGFEREEFEEYNDTGDEVRRGDHFATRLLTLFEQVHIGDSTLRRLSWRYPLQPLAPSTIFPVEAATYEQRDREGAKSEYRRLWNAFEQGLERIPRSHRHNWPLWLDHFDTLWLTFTHAIPSATYKVKPEVSLYDHSRTVAALAVALWRWHDASGRTDDAATRALRDRTDYTEPKFLLIQGDFFGIQNFVFAAGGETRRQAAKLLRGRSFQVALFTELAALRIMDELALPPTSQVLNAAGKFLIVAPNTNEVRGRLNELRKEFDGWFLRRTFGLAGLGLAWEKASCNDFLKRTHGQASPYSNLLDSLYRSLARAKHCRFDLCGVGTPALDSKFPHGVCNYNGWLPADRPRLEDEPASCTLSRDQIEIGQSLLRFDRLLVLRQDSAEELRAGGSLRKLDLDMLGYVVAFTEPEEARGRFGNLARSGALERCWDFSPASPDAGGEPLWSGYARRSISGYAPTVTSDDLAAPNRYRCEEVELGRERDLKTLDMIACEDRQLDAEGEWAGIEALGVLKGDVDDLGEIFHVGLGEPTFAKTAALSRQLNSFFGTYLPWLLAREFRDVYTIFAGGDDFFLIAPWRTAQKLANRMHQEFARYAASNPHSRPA
jgi:CRISPR-associated protein Csm1